MLVLQLIGSTYHIHIYSDIDSNWGFSMKDLQTDLKQIKPTDRVVVHINSMGGSVYEGLAIYNVLRSLPNPVEGIVEGIAASIASVIFLGCKIRKMYDNATIMIHNPWFSNISGNADDLKKSVDLLEGAEANTLGIYKSHLSASEDQIKTWLSEETYFDADEAKAIGFVSEIIKPPSASAYATLDKLVAKLKKGSKDMNFETWLAKECQDLGLDISKLTDQQKTAFKARFDSLQVPQSSGGTPVPVARAVPATAPVAEPQSAADREAAELDRLDSLRAIAAEHDQTEFDEDYLKGLKVNGKTIRALHSHAVRQKWTPDKFELEVHRASIKSTGHVGIQMAPGRLDLNLKALSCALVKEAQIPAQAAHKVTGQKFGYEVDYDQQTLEASDRYRNISIMQIFDMAHEVAFGYRYRGRINTDGAIRAYGDALRKLRAEGNTQWTALNIFDDAANKMLWAAYQLQSTTWQEWVKPVSVNDFKTSNFYRLTMTGGYHKVGADGMLKHGGFTDSKLTAKAETFGKIVGLSRTDLINDDLGAFNAVMSGLGAEGAVFLEELFYAYLLDNLTTIFPTNNSNGNYVSGATSTISVDGYTAVENAFSNMVNADYQPILQSPSIVLCGVNNRVLAQEMYTKLNLEVLQTANAKGRPEGNPHVGKYRPVTSAYINNTGLKRRIDGLYTAFTNQTQTGYALVASPNMNGGIVLGAFLNGRQTPFVEQADNDFDNLGMLWRAYQDAGASTGDVKMAVWSKGAA